MIKDGGQPSRDPALSKYLSFYVHHHRHIFPPRRGGAEEQGQSRLISGGLWGSELWGSEVVRGQQEMLGLTGTISKEELEGGVFNSLGN